MPPVPEYRESLQRVGSKLSETIETLHTAKNHLTEAQKQLQSLAQESEDPELRAAAKHSQGSILAIGEVAVLLSRYPQQLDKYLTQAIGTQPLERIAALPAPPSFSEQANDPNLNKPITLTNPYNGNQVTTTEQQALRELQDFLRHYLAKGTDDDLKMQAESMLESLNFISEKELNQAIEGMVNDWQHYLDTDQKRQIALISLRGRIKSGDLIIEKALGQISPKKLESYRGRLVLELWQLRAPPEKTRVIIPDDWTVSGDQLNRTCQKLAENNPRSPYMKRIEANLVIAPPGMLQQGFKPFEADDRPNRFKHPIPVKAHFEGRPPKHPGEEPMHVSGTHSSVDFGFRLAIDDMSEDLADNTDAAVDCPAIVDINASSQLDDLPLTKKMLSSSSQDYLL